eukprot:TRINITY_DN6861_c0_g2_i1.p1 TRINITY_DN6861_c0_g2~~TRINITY_DN6861_c0_g2_i1.p1  ORF type:complete len:142 (-),score=19.66 TRINITY_DN6861_c0_g2_i1:233-658(-)
MAIETEKKVYTVEDLKQHTDEKSCYLAIHGKVYDVTEFLEEHPGGYDIILQSTGRDATDDFEDIGHSRSAKQMLEQYYIGEYEGGAEKENGQKSNNVNSRQDMGADDSQTSNAVKIFQALIPVLLILAAVGFKLYGMYQDS